MRPTSIALDVSSTNGYEVFLGRMPPEASTLSLQTNVGEAAAAVDVTDRDRDTDIPRFFINGTTIP